MYYGYTITDSENREYTGAVYADDFTDAMVKIDNYYEDIPAVSVTIVCLTENECLDVDEFEDREDEPEHEDTCDGNFTIKAHTTITPHLDIEEKEFDKLEDLIKMLAELEAKEK